MQSQSGMTAHLQVVVDQTFDFVIAGGGTSGLTLAARLTENPDITVLVLEAGEENLNDPAILRPGQYGSHFNQDAYAWDFKTTAQKHCNGKQYIWPRGKGLGGSSSINFSCWTKPPAEDIDDWERLGNPSWNWEIFEKYSNKTEKFVYPVHHKDKFAGWKVGSDGPLAITHPATLLDIEVKVQETLVNMGISVAPNPLGGDPTGAFFAPCAIDPQTHMRTYAASAFFVPNMHRSNLSVLVSANVNRIITEADSSSDDLVATGVEFSSGGQLYIVNASKEVILCAGALKSPHILELSGIGRRDVLENLLIPVKLELPGVGENVQEHQFSGVTFELPNHISGETFDLLRDPEVTKQHVDLLSSGQGLFTMGITGFSFMSLHSISERAESINTAAKEKISNNASSYPPGLLEQYNIQLERLERGAPGCELIFFPGLLSFPSPPIPGKRYFTISAATNHNFSRGSIHSISVDPKVNPAFDPHYFEEDIDLQTFIEIVKFIRKIPEHEPFKTIFGSPVKELNPGPEVVTDAQIGDHLKEHMMTTYHTAGSLSMLPRDKWGVVDPNLKVHGTSNIRVIDLSIVPLHFASHPQSTAYTLAERAADIIKESL